MANFVSKPLRPNRRRVLRTKRNASSASGNSSTRFPIYSACYMRMTAMPSCWFSRPWTRPERTAPSGVWWAGSTRPDARYFRSNSLPLKSWTMIFYGAVQSACPNAAESASSTAVITKKCWWSGYTRNISKPRSFRMMSIWKTSGSSAMYQSAITKSIWRLTGPSY